MGYGPIALVGCRSNCKIATVLAWHHLITALNSYLYNVRPVVDFCCCGHQKDLATNNMPWDEAKRQPTKLSWHGNQQWMQYIPPLIKWDKLRS